MKNDSTTTFLNLVLAAMVIIGVILALVNIWHTRDLRRLQSTLQLQVQKSQITSARAQALLNDTIMFNNTAKNPELAQIIQAAQTPVSPAK